MLHQTKFCGNEEPHEGHGWAKFSVDGKSFDLYDCYGLPEGYYGDL